jgi:hypothetical protein
VKAIAITKDGKVVPDDEAYMITQDGTQVLRSGYSIRVPMMMMDHNPAATALLRRDMEAAPARSVIVDGAGGSSCNTPGFRFAAAPTEANGVQDAIATTRALVSGQARQAWIDSDTQAWRPPVADASPSAGAKAGDPCHSGGRPGKLAWSRSGLACVLDDPAQAKPTETGDRARPDFAGKAAAHNQYLAELGDAWRTPARR